MIYERPSRSFEPAKTCTRCKYWQRRPDTNMYGDCGNTNIGFNWTQMEQGKSQPEQVETSKQSIGYTEMKDISLWTGAYFGCIHFEPLERKV